MRIAILPREEAFQIPDLIRTKINLLPPQIQEVRTVELVGLDLQADDVEKVHIRSLARAADILADPSKYDPRSKETADHSLPYVIAAAVADRQVTPLQFTDAKIMDPRIRAQLDKVKVIAGKDKGKVGKVLKVSGKKNRLLVENINIVKRHTKPNAQNRQGGILESDHRTGDASGAGASGQAVAAHGGAHRQSIVQHLAVGAGNRGAQELNNRQH